jgi:predicted amidohydrolase
MNEGATHLGRRDVLRAGLGLLAGCASVGTSGTAAPKLRHRLGIGLCHLDVQPGDLEGNCARVERAMHLAAKGGARWVVTPELALSGYHFVSRIGTDWIAPTPDRYTARLVGVAKSLGIALWLGHAERDPVSDHRYNSLLAFDRQGRLRGRHRKINTIPGSESWSTPGTELRPIVMDGVSVGPLVCADAWPPDHAQRLAAQGAQLLLSCANWAAEPHGPGGTWEARSAETRLPLVVCNRTGRDDGLDFGTSASVVSVGGKRAFTLTQRPPAVAVVQLDLGAETLLEGSHVIPCGG